MKTIPQTSLLALKRHAKRIGKARMLKATVALDEAAREFGFDDYQHALKHFAPRG